ncbi:MAG: YkoF family thiamine/hydroxymethylpyrimidine-binding protein [bacterium]
MNVQAEVSLYPLRTRELAGPVETFCQGLARTGLDVETGPMSTRIAGDLDAVFDGLRQAFRHVAERHDVVLAVKLSNCCAQQHDRETP